MSKHYFYPGARKYKFLYLFYNKGYDAYKFGITSMPIEERIKTYCKYAQKSFYGFDNNGFKTYEYPFSENDITVIYFKELENVQGVELKINSMVNGFRLKLKGQQWPFKEHFVGQEKANEILSYLSNLS
jgi:hypothetical protein